MASSDIEKYSQRMEELIEKFSASLQQAHPFDMKAMEVTLPQFMVLKFISQNDNCKMSELSTAMKVTMGNMTGMIDRLEREGYVNRSEDPEDRRIVRVKIAKRGINAVSNMINHRNKSIKHMFGRLSENEMHTLVKIMEKLAKGSK
ncbi:MarR family winged helix-turn-helix transcriptional regulator [Candidatus Margulisiibacteriota bacterium]